MKVPYSYRQARASGRYDPEAGYEPEEERPSLWVRFWKAAAFYIITALVFLLINLFVLRLGVVNGSSMEPTLHDHDVVVIWQLGYQPQAGDIIVTNKDNELGISLTKRVIATGGQHVRIQEGAVFVDGAEQLESYLLEDDNQSVSLDTVVPAGQVFLMGDNRNGSYDSRALGSFDTGDIMGEVILRIWPFSGIRGFSN